MSYVIYNKETTIILRASRKHTEYYKSETAAKAALTRITNDGRLPTMRVDTETGFKTRQTVKADYAIAEVGEFRKNIEKQIERTNLMSGKKFMEPINAPACCSPASETYWSM